MPIVVQVQEEQQWGEEQVLSPLPQPQRMNLTVLSGIHISVRDWI